MQHSYRVIIGGFPNLHRNRVHRVEQEMRIELHAEGAEPGLGQLGGELRGEQLPFPVAAIEIGGVDDTHDRAIPQQVGGQGIHGKVGEHLEIERNAGMEADQVPKCHDEHRKTDVNRRAAGPRPTVRVESVNGPADNGSEQCPAIPEWRLENGRPVPGEGWVFGMNADIHLAGGQQAHQRGQDQ
jgi:hypothetical protein